MNIYQIQQIVILYKEQNKKLFKDVIGVTKQFIKGVIAVMNCKDIISDKINSDKEIATNGTIWKCISHSVSSIHNVLWEKSWSLILR